ncbi:hypothetical protein [Paraburkholderia acidisoli]|uniref:Uncharacterized protein n=1 Tax=Paraburkholderia acidisoli TaxID=2571748 RepID=A0A7Z2GQJ0_9BURK|nr:hypothetical protein [Paraburkholderia acidisoli]QGZ66045.1 hypothetical protein FAZ98_29970 [Paraburkholderia acidisoli]
MTRKHSPSPEDDPIWAEARALETSIRAIRRAQGKKNPEDFPPDSPECLEAMEAFVRDVGRILGLYVGGGAAEDDGELHGTE